MITIPEGWKEEWEKNVRRLYLCGRKHDMSIPDDQLDFMRDALVAMKDAENIIAQRDELLAALKYHQDQTRPIQATIDLIAKCEAQS